MIKYKSGCDTLELIKVKDELDEGGHGQTS